MPAEPNTMIQLVQDLGFGMASLTFSGWLIVFLLRGFEKKETFGLRRTPKAIFVFQNFCAKIHSYSRPPQKSLRTFRLRSLSSF
jgi:hypothetical protein